MKPGTVPETGKTVVPVFFVIHIDSVTGRQSAASGN